ncbi:MAG: thiamine pyrophosphate-binding protein [Desulfobacterales bacterium]
MTAAYDKICDVLVEAGIDHVFGIPGGGTIPIWNALYDRQDRIKAVLTRHEQAASCMADIYGRVTGRPAVLMGQGAFIASSGGFGILEAYLSNTPMLILTDTSDMGTFSQHASYQSGTGEYGSFDIRDILKAMSKFTTYAVTPEEAVQGIQLAVKHAMAGRPGPAAVVMRSSAISGDIDENRVPRIYPTSGYLKGSLPTAPREEIKKAVGLLSEAKTPVIIAGNGVHLSKSYDALRRLSESLGIPVASSYKGKSVFPETHPLALGMMGSFGQKLANDEIARADVILVAGCHLAPSDTLFESPDLIKPDAQTIIQIDIDPRNAGWTYPVSHALVGDLKHIMGSMADMVDRNSPAAENRESELAERKRASEFFTAPEAASDDIPLLPQRIVCEIDKAVDEHALITLDAGNNRLWMSHFFKSKAAGSVFCPGGAAGMGYGPPAALGLKLLHPNRPVLSVSGDGGFAMVPHVLSTAVQYRLPVAFLVMNNSGLGMVRDIQGDKIIATEFSPTDFARIAQGFGCRGVTVHRAEEIQPAISEAFGADLPTVIDVITSPSEPFFKIWNR